MSDRDSDIGAFITGFVVGGLVGAAVALLLAPQSGEETRTLIREKSIELKKMFKDVKAVLEQWKFSVEETKEGMRIELHAVALRRFAEYDKRTGGETLA